MAITRECKIVLFLIIMLVGAGALIAGIFIAAIGITSEVVSADGNYGEKKKLKKKDSPHH